MKESPVILLVEDDADDAFLFRRTAHQVDPSLRVQHVADGQAAIDYLMGSGQYADRTQYPMPHVAVVDLKMPVCDGFDFLKWKRDQVALTCLPAIVMTSSDAEKDIQRSYELGAHSFTSKLVNPSQLEHRLRSLCDWWFKHCQCARA